MNTIHKTNKNSAVKSCENGWSKVTLKTRVTSTGDFSISGNEFRQIL